MCDDANLSVCIDSHKKGDPATHPSLQRFASDTHFDLLGFPPNPHLVTDRFGNIEQANRAAALLFKETCENLIGKSLTHFIPSAEHATFHAKLAELAHLNSVGNVAAWHLNIKIAGADPRLLSVAVTTIGDAKSPGPVLLWRLRDLGTEQLVQQELFEARAALDDSSRRYELEETSQTLENMLEEQEPALRTLEKSKEWYWMLLHQSAEAIFLCDIETRRIIETNAAFLRLLGYNTEEATQLGLADLLAYDEQEIGIYLRKVMERDEVHVRERLWRAKNRTLLPIEVTSVIIPQNNRNILFCVGRNVAKLREEEREKRQQADEFITLYDIYRDLAEYQDPLKLLPKIMERARTLLHAPSGGIYLYNAQESVLELAFTSGNAVPLGSRLKMGEGLGGRVAQTRQPFVVANYMQWEHRPPQYAGFPFGASVGVPLLDRGELIGVLTISEWENQSRTFTEREVSLIGLFASQAATAFANAKLFERLSEGRERLRLLSHQLLQAQELERRYLARNLHDEIGPALAGLNINLQLILRATGDPKIQMWGREGLETVEEILAQVRDLSQELRPSVLDELGLAAAIDWFLKTRVERAGPRAELVSTLPTNCLESEVQLACFRIAQEALTNVMRHARATRVTVELRLVAEEKPGGATFLEMIIKDNGIGFDLEAARLRASGGSSLGLIGMQERALLVGGSVEIFSRSGEGTTLRAHLPAVLD